MTQMNGEFSYKDSVSLKEYFTTILTELRSQCNENFKDIEKEMNFKFEARDKALELHSDMLNKRLDNMNEFRQAMNDQTKHFLTKEEYSVRHELLQNKMDMMQKIVWGLAGAFLVIDYIIKFVK